MDNYRDDPDPICSCPAWPAGRWRFVVAVCDLIPMIGATLGAAACALVALATSLWPTTILVAAFFVLYQQHLGDQCL